MGRNEDILTMRKSLDEICSVPEKIISVYSLEKHVWADSNAPTARHNRQPELQTVEEFQIDPVRPFLNDVFRGLSAPYKPERRDNPIGQGYWIQAEFGSGKSHLLCFLSALALGSLDAWDVVRDKEQKAGRGKRESLYRFWEEGLQTKSGQDKKGLFVVVKTLVGAGGGAVGISDTGKRLAEYILDAAKEQMQIELGRNVSLYPAELLADRFLSEDLDRFRADLKKFLRDPRFFDEDEFEEINDFVRDVQQNKSPEYKRSCGNKLWLFYTEYLKVQPQIAAETEDILKHMVEAIMAEGYSGVLLVLDEVSLFMKNRRDDQRTDDEKTLVVLSNRLAKVHNLPIWTVCAAQQAIESKMGVKNIIADDRLKLVKLLEEDKDYYDIILARVREIKEPGAVSNYYLHYKRGFTWPYGIGEQEFTQFFPFHKPALEVLRAITYELTTARSAIHFMHQTLKHQVKNQGRELIRLWELFDEAIRYEEDPSGVHAGLVAIKTKRETDYRAYEACKRQIDGLTKGYLKVYRDKAVKTVQTLFLYYIARTKQQGLIPEEIANSVLIERDFEANPDENIQHYETLTENLRKELRQIAQGFDEDKRPRYRFDPVITGIDPREEFRKARDEAESNENMLREAWEHLLVLDEWPVRTRQMTLDLSNGVQSIFREIAPFEPPWKNGPMTRGREQVFEVTWQGRKISGLIQMHELGRIAADNLLLPPIQTSETDWDFAVFVGTRPVSLPMIEKLLMQRNDPRILIWVPGELSYEDRERLLAFAAYRKLVSDWQGKDTEDGVAVIHWMADALQGEMARFRKIVDNSFARGRIDALNNSQMDFHMAGELKGILAPLIDRVLAAVYESRDIKFDPPFTFSKEDGPKVINGIVKTGRIPKGAKPNQNISAAQNFGFGLKIIRKGAEKELDTVDNAHLQDMWSFIDDKLVDERQSMKVETLYKNFMGIGGPKDYGLTRRMVQIYLFCLVQQGKVRVEIGPKSGLPFSLIDYSNLAGIDFSAKVLDALVEIQKMARPEHWEVLRPYAEKLLGKNIPSTHDDAVISAWRTELRKLFDSEKEESRRTSGKAASLFELLKTSNPYERPLQQAVMLFATDLTVGDDINLVLYGLKEAYGYQAFDSGVALESEVDDLANRLRNYHDLKRFLTYEAEIRVAHAYCHHSLPELPFLKGMRNLQRKIADKLADLQPYIDSEFKLKTELIGRTPPDAGETGTLGVLIHEYTTAYAALHDTVLDGLDGNRRAIQVILQSDDLRALKILERITALQPPVAGDIERELAGMTADIFACPSPSRASVEEHLRRGPVHECGLSFQNASGLREAGRIAEEKAREILNRTFDRKLIVFLNPAVRERLAQGVSEPVIAGLFECTTVSEVRAYLVKAVLADDSVVELVNRYLKRIRVKTVKMAEFKPSINIVEKEQIIILVREFQQYLEEHLQSIEVDEDTLPMLQVE